MFTRMKQRRGLASDWTALNPILSDGEIGYEKDTGYFKVGNGIGEWSVLPYQSDKALADHLNDTTDAHDASSITFSPFGNISSTDIQAAIEAVSSTIEFSSVNAAATGAITLPNVDDATLNRLTLTGNVTLTLPSPAVGKSFTLAMVQDATGGRTVTYVGNGTTVRWPGDVTPTMTPGANKKDVYTFLCENGTQWLGFVAGQNYSV